MSASLRSRNHPDHGCRPPLDSCSLPVARAPQNRADDSDERRRPVGGSSFCSSGAFGRTVFLHAARSASAVRPGGRGKGMAALNMDAAQWRAASCLDAESSPIP